MYPDRTSTWSRTIIVPVLFAAVLLTAIAGCGTSKTDGGPDIRLEFVPLGRYVTETNVFWDFREYMRSMADGSFEYDDIIRSPHTPPGPIEISCSDTERIGAMVVLTGRTERVRETRYSRKIYISQVSVKYSWSHSGTNIRGGRYQSRTTPLSNGVVSDGLTLTKKDRVNGVITLTMSHYGETIYETSFKLSDCESDA